MASSNDMVSPAHGVFEFGDIQFSSCFDNGNLQFVERLEGGGGPYDFKIWSAYDNHGTPHQSKHCSWFHFSLSGIPAGVVLRLYLINGGHHNNLYKYDMRPVYRCNSTNNKWVRLKMPVKQRRSESGETVLLMEHNMEAENDKIFFAFTYPYSYANLMTDLAVLDNHFNDFNNPDAIVAYREHIISTSEDRRIELITITSADGSTEEREPPLPGLFPEILDKSDLLKRPRVFPNKEVLFISSRVHPGEVPAQHVWKGMFQFLMDPNDLCARAIRAHYVVKMIPMLNPDGVFHGHFRMDQLGQNLNRYYHDTNQSSQPSIFAAKSLLDYYSNNKSLSLYIDLHAHASKRGCFIYGNVLDNIEDQIQNQLFCKLISINTPHFDYEGCLFNKEHMSRIDPGDLASGLTAEGSGRVSTYLQHGLIHSYTLECNYNCSRFGNEVNATEIETGGQYNTPASPFTANPEKYTPSIYWGVGRASLIAMLDIRGQNPCSRITKSKTKSLEKVRNAIVSEVRQKKDFKTAKDANKRGGGGSVGVNSGVGGSSGSSSSVNAREKSDSIDGDEIENVVQEKAIAIAQKETTERDFVMSDHAAYASRGMLWRRTVSSPATTVRISKTPTITLQQQPSRSVPIKSISPSDVVSSLINTSNGTKIYNKLSNNVKAMPANVERKAISGKVFQNELLQPHKPAILNHHSQDNPTSSRPKGAGKRLQLATDGLSYLINNAPSNTLKVVNPNSIHRHQDDVNSVGGGWEGGGGVTALGSVSAHCTHRSGGNGAKAAYENIKMKAQHNSCTTNGGGGVSILVPSGSHRGEHSNGSYPEVYYPDITSEKDNVMPPIQISRSNSSGPFENSQKIYQISHTMQTNPQVNLQSVSPSISPNPSRSPIISEVVVRSEKSPTLVRIESRKLDINSTDKSPSQSRFLPKLDSDDVNMALESLGRKMSQKKCPGGGGDSENKTDEQMTSFSSNSPLGGKIKSNDNGVVVLQSIDGSLNSKIISVE